MPSFRLVLKSPRIRRDLPKAPLVVPGISYLPFAWLMSQTSSLPICSKVACESASSASGPQPVPQTMSSSSRNRSMCALVVFQRVLV